MKALAVRLEHSAVGFVGKGNGQRSTFDARGDGGTREGVAMSGVSNGLKEKIEKGERSNTRSNTSQ